ncbi:hypothetical protein QS257_10905 [Terrilactibacillus sp. S3-3]|nr:hypothetical protein QS257_10905 [Terrilactibacillus sp. S3-3]
MRKSNARAGKPAFIHAKMNALSDDGMIKALYRASAEGVKIDLLVRGICCLRPGIPGVSDNITVHSIVGRYLEHSRIYHFAAGGENKVFLASADMMPRNLNRRVELMFPVEDEKIKATIIELFETMMADNVKTRVMDSNGNYRKLDRRGKELLNVQEYFAQMAEQKAIASDRLRKNDRLCRLAAVKPILTNWTANKVKAG